MGFIDRLRCKHDYIFQGYKRVLNIGEFSEWYSMKKVSKCCKCGKIKKRDPKGAEWSACEFILRKIDKAESKKYKNAVDKYIHKIEKLVIIE